MKKSKKNLLARACLVGCIAACSSSTPVTAGAPTTPTIVVNNTTLYSTVNPYIANGTTMVPLRVISEYLGAQVDWNASTRGITISKNGSKVELTVGSQIAKINGSSTQLAIPPTIVNGSTMVPLRFIGEALSCKVSWEAPTKIVRINTTDSEIDTPDKITEDQYGRKIRTTNLPKNANDFPYIVEGVPNWCYEKASLARSNNFFSGYYTQKADGSYTNEKCQSTPKEFFTDGSADYYPINLTGIYSKVNEFISMQTNVDYKTIDYTYADKMMNLIPPADLELISGDLSAKEYLKTYVDAVKRSEIVTSSEYEILPETLWVDYNNKLHVSVYMKFKLESANKTIYAPTLGAMSLADADFERTPTEPGKVYEGVVTYTLVPNKALTVGNLSATDWRIQYTFSDIIAQMHPSVNMLDGAAPGTEDKNAPQKFAYSWVKDDAQWGKVKLSKYEIPKIEAAY